MLARWHVRTNQEFSPSNRTERISAVSLSKRELKYQEWNAKKNMSRKFLCINGVIYVYLSSDMYHS